MSQAPHEAQQNRPRAFPGLKVIPAHAEHGCGQLPAPSPHSRHLASLGPGGSGARRNVVRCHRGQLQELDERAGVGVSGEAQGGHRPRRGPMTSDLDEQPNLSTLRRDTTP